VIGRWFAPQNSTTLKLYSRPSVRLYGIEQHDPLAVWTLPQMILEPFGDLTDAKIIVAYRDEPRQSAGGLIDVPRIVLLEYSTGYIRLLRGSEIDAVLNRLNADYDQHDQDAGC
jgi:hypothetical protein